MSAPCTNCGKRPGSHGADEFPSVNLCYPCVRDLFEWIHDAGVADGNPLIAAFWYAPITIVTHSDRGGSTFSYARLHGFKLSVCK